VQFATGECLHRPDCDFGKRDLGAIVQWYQACWVKGCTCVHLDDIFREFKRDITVNQLDVLDGIPRLCYGKL
jgi:hypothetical protein